MSKAFNLGQLGNNVNANGQLNGSTGVYNTVPSAKAIIMDNFTIQQSGTTKINFLYGATIIAQLDSNGNLKCIGNITAYSGTIT